MGVRREILTQNNRWTLIVNVGWNGIPWRYLHQKPFTPFASWVAFFVCRVIRCWVIVIFYCGPELERRREGKSFFLYFYSSIFHKASSSSSSPIAAGPPRAGMTKDIRIIQKWNHPHLMILISFVLLVRLGFFFISLYRHTSSVSTSFFLFFLVSLAINLTCVREGMFLIRGNISWWMLRGSRRH